MLLLTIALVVLAADPMEARLRETAYARVRLAQTMARKAELVAFVVDKNAQAESLEKIRHHDQNWAADPLRKTLTQNACASALKALISTDPVVVEILLMDSRGALVCATAETSDYYQGDEAKWQKPFGEGVDPFIDAPSVDSNTNTYSIQVSVPVSEGGRRIGALTLTLRLATQGKTP